jgi:hypoxanthine-DNA glycosylase
MLETHPFPPFVPPHAKHLLLGSFTGKPGVGYDWFYGSQRNQFWPILERVYNLKLDTKKSKMHLFSRLGLAITDIIYQCERRQGTNLDANLINIVYNLPALEKILSQNKIVTIFFSSRFVETKFKRLFKNVHTRLITLPSPSPRYARMTLQEKIKIYAAVLPKVKQP